MIHSNFLSTSKHNTTMMSGHVSKQNQFDKAYFIPVNHTVCLTSSGFCYHPKEENFIPCSCAAYKIIQDSKCKTCIDFQDQWTLCHFHVSRMKPNSLLLLFWSKKYIVYYSSRYCQYHAVVSIKIKLNPEPLRLRMFQLLKGSHLQRNKFSEIPVISPFPRG